jgi:hypothetical protein
MLYLVIPSAFALEMFVLEVPQVYWMVPSLENGHVFESLFPVERNSSFLTEKVSLCLSQKLRL